MRVASSARIFLWRIACRQIIPSPYGHPLLYFGGEIMCSCAAIPLRAACTPFISCTTRMTHARPQKMERRWNLSPRHQHGRSCLCRSLHRRRSRFPYRSARAVVRRQSRRKPQGPDARRLHRRLLGSLRRWHVRRHRIRHAPGPVRAHPLPGRPRNQGNEQSLLRKLGQQDRHPVATRRQRP